MPIPAGMLAVGSLLTKAGLGIAEHIEAKDMAKKVTKQREEQIQELEAYQSKQDQTTRSKLNSIMAQIGMAKDSQKVSTLGSIYAGTKQASDMERSQIRQQKMQLEASKPIAPSFNVMSTIADIGTGALEGYQLGLALEDQQSQMDFRDQMRKSFMGMLDTEDKLDFDFNIDMGDTYGTDLIT